MYARTYVAYASPHVHTRPYMDNELRSASQSMHDSSERSAYAPAAHDKPSRKIPKFPFVLVAVLLIVAAGGYSFWKFVLNKPTKILSPATSQVDTTPKVINDVPSAPATESYTSTALSVSFKYPKKWKVIEASGGIRVESPGFTYNAVGLGDIAGNFRLYLRQGARPIDGSYIGKGIAIKSSEKLVYSQPAIGQRTDTLISFFGSETFESFSFFMIVGNFQLNLGDSLGSDYGREPDTYIMAGGYSTPAAIDDMATNAVPLDYYATTTAYKQAVAIVASLQLK